MIGRTRLLAALRRARFPRSRRLRLLFVYPFCGLGGVETATLAKITALRRLGIDASVLFSEFYGDGARAFATQQGVTVGLPDEQAIAQLVREGFDAVAVIDYPDFIDILRRTGVQKPILFETHCGVPASLERFYRCLDDPRLRAIIVPSHHNERLIRERVTPSSRVVVVPNAIDERLFRPGKITSPPLMRSLLNGEKLVLWVGRLEDGKNPAELIEVAEQLIMRDAGLKFLVIGDLPGSYDERVTQLLQKMRASTRSAFSFTRTVPYNCMPDIYRLVEQSGGALISTSLYESLPMIFIEAMACGCPVISSDVGGVRDLIVNGSTGYLYAAGDVTAAVAKLQYLLDCGNRRDIKRVTRHARRHVRRYHSLPVVAARYRDLLNEIIA